MPSSADLVCVDPARVPEFWPHAGPMIRAAIERTGLSDFGDIEGDVLAGRQLLWLAWSGAIEAAATTKLVKVGTRKICIIVACSGHARDRWLSLLEQIETYARNEGCSKTRIYGRRGWQRILSGYSVENVILERAL